MFTAKPREGRWKVLDQSQNFWSQSESLEVFFSRICAHTVRLIKKLSENSVTFNSPCAAPFLCAVQPKVMWRYSPVTVILHQQHQHQTLELFGNQDWVLATRTVEHFLGGTFYTWPLHWYIQLMDDVWWYRPKQCQCRQYQYQEIHLESFCIWHEPCFLNTNIFHLVFLWIRRKLLEYRYNPFGIFMNETQFVGIPI